MYAVIFKAKIKNLNADYFKTATRMQDLAIREYGCIEFNSACENGFEIAISYWDNLEQIQQWKQNTEHLEAQKQGKKNWYQTYSVEIVEVLRQYQSSDHLSKE